MIGRILLLCAVLLLPDLACAEDEQAAHTPPTVAPPPAKLAIVHDLDALFLLQDATARGRGDAATLQKPLLRSIGRAFTTTTDDPNRLAPHAAAYVLSGGDPEVADALAGREGMQQANRRMLEGVALFMRNDREEAAKRLASIDTALLPRRLAGRMALAQALLEKDGSLAQQRFALAMAAMPGTLVEESSLRRSALAHAAAHEEAAFWKRLTRYQRRFPDSLYARSFWEEVMGHLATWHAKPPGPSLDRLDLVLGTMPLSRRRALYLQLTRRAASQSDVALVQFAADRVRRLSEEGSLEDQVAAFYVALYAIASAQGDAALKQLQSVNRGLLLPEERALLLAGLSIGQQIARPMMAPATDDTAEKSPLMSRGESLLGDIDRLLADQGS